MQFFNMGDKGYVFILDQDGNIVYHPRQQQLYNELQTENISLVMNAESDIVTVGKGDDEKIYALSHSEITGWTIVGCMNMSELLRNSRQTRSIYVLVALGLIIVALLISSVIARNITMPIQKLRDSMKSVQKGNFDIEDIEVLTDNEIGSLTRSFNVMTHRIRELMEQNVKEQEQKRKIELKALQSQINPHFLYNTLDTIYMLARMNKEETTMRMIQALSKYLRLCLSKGSEIVSVEDELENVKSYMEIQQIRNADLFEYEIDCQVNAKGNKILKLILQPLVENAVKYGFSEIYEGGYIRIRITEENDVLVLSVYNTGMPMNKDMVEKINGLTHLPISQIKKAFPDKKHGYGVFNILTRLRLKYGDKITYYYETTDASTTCTIKVPKGGEQES